MDPKQQAFLKAYTEHALLIPSDQNRSEINPSLLSTRTQETLARLDRKMKENETALFNQQNVHSHLKALSADGQNLSMELNLNNPEHTRKLNMASIAFSDDVEQWQGSSLPLEDKFRAMQVKVAIRCDQKQSDNPSIWHKRLGLLKDIAVQGSAAALVTGIEGGLAGAAAGGIGAAPGALMGAGYGFFGSALTLTMAYAFTPIDSSSAKGSIDCEVVSLLPEYFISGQVSDNLLTPEAQNMKQQAFHLRLGEQTLNHLQQSFPCSEEDRNRCYQPGNLQRVGALIAQNGEDTERLLQSILKQQGVAAQVAARDRQAQKQAYQHLAVLLGGADKKLTQIQAQMSAEQRAKRVAAKVEQAKQAAAGLAQLGADIQSPFLQKIGNMGGALIGLEQAVLSTAQTFNSLAQDGIGSFINGDGIPGLNIITGCFSLLAGPLGIISAAYRLFSLFGGAKKNDGLAKALRGISQQIVALHKEMRESFQCTWEMLNTMEKRQYERFTLTLEAIDAVGQALSLYFEAMIKAQQAMSYHLQAGMARLENYVQHIADQSMRIAFEQARLADSKAMSANLNHYTACIHVWLTSTAILAANTGVVNVPSLGSEAQTLWISQLAEQLSKAAQSDQLNKPLGFYQSLLQSIMPNWLSGLTIKDFVCPSTWLPVQKAYVALIYANSQNIVKLEPKVREEYFKTFEQLRKMADTNLQLIKRLGDPQYNTLLISELVNHYHKALNIIRETIHERIMKSNEILHENYKTSVFRLDQPIQQKAFDLSRDTDIISHVPGDIFPKFLELLATQQPSFNSTLQGLLNQPVFTKAYANGIAKLKFVHGSPNMQIFGLMMPSPIHLSVDIQGTTYLLCDGSFFSFSQLVRVGRKKRISHFQSVAGIQPFNPGNLDSILQALTQAVPQEEALAMQRKAVVGDMAILISNLQRRYLELITLLQWMAPELSLDVFNDRAATRVETAVNTLSHTPTVEHLQALVTVLGDKCGVQGEDAVTELCSRLQHEIQSHPLMSVFQEAVTSLQSLQDVLSAAIESHDTGCGDPIPVLEKAYQQVQSIESFEQALATNQVAQFNLEANISELQQLKIRLEALALKTFDPAKGLAWIDEELTNAKTQLETLVSEASELYQQYRHIKSTEIKPALTQSMARWGLMPGPRDNAVASSSSSLSLNIGDLSCSPNNY